MAFNPIHATPNLCPSSHSSVALALGALTVWHAVLISRGETSIERHINKKERQRLQAKGRVSRAGTGVLGRVGNQTCCSVKSWFFSHGQGQLGQA